MRYGGNSAIVEAHAGTRPAFPRADRDRVADVPERHRRVADTRGCRGPRPACRTGSRLWRLGDVHAAARASPRCFLLGVRAGSAGTGAKRTAAGADEPRGARRGSRSLGRGDRSLPPSLRREFHGLSGRNAARRSSARAGRADGPRGPDDRSRTATRTTSGVQRPARRRPRAALSDRAGGARRGARRHESVAGNGSHRSGRSDRGPTAADRTADGRRPRRGGRIRQPRVGRASRFVATKRAARRRSRRAPRRPLHAPRPDRPNRPRAPRRGSRPCIGRGRAALPASGRARRTAT